MNFIMGKDDEFEDEPEDELASAGMHVVENDEDDDEDAKIKEEDEEEISIETDDEEVEDEKKEDTTNAFEDALDGLKELEELEKSVLSPLTFGGDDEV